MASASFAYYIGAEHSEQPMPRAARKKKTLPALPSVEGPPAIQRRQITTANGAVLREPMVEHAEWRDPDDLNPNARAPRVVVAFRRVDQLLKLAEAGTGITDEHVTAGQRFMRDAEAADGARPGRDLAEGRIDGAQSGPGDSRLFALRRYREAVQAVGQRGSAIVTLVVVENCTISDLARRLGVKQHYAALGMLIAALDRLAEHYWPKAPRQ
jgi:hypothetical protein